ncbi:MAG: hypothetical protein QXT38_02345 [Candidatus Aenigmatarchaeota archaeon]
MNNIVRGLQLLLVALILVFGIFLSGCTNLPLDSTAPAFSARTSNGLLIKNVNYESKISEKSDVEIVVNIENAGYDANNVKITLFGLTDRWTPKPPISENIGSLKSGETYEKIFRVKSPEIAEDRTDSFGLKLEYDYTSVYEAKIVLRKKDKNITVSLEGERLVKPAPITFKLSSHKISNNVLYLNFSVSNEGSGKTNEIRIYADGISCDSSADLKNKSRVSCSVEIPSFDEVLVKEFQLRAAYRYEYQTDLVYKINVYKIKPESE